MTALAMTVEPVEIIEVDTLDVACDGGELGHPRVYLRLKGGEVTCPYCSRKFVLKKGARADGGH